MRVCCEVVLEGLVVLPYVVIEIRDIWHMNGHQWPVRKGLVEENGEDLEVNEAVYELRVS